MLTPKTSIIFVLAALAVGFGLYLLYPTPQKYQNPQEPLACTLEAKQCPDGSYVGRDPENNCEFKACPNNLPPGSQMEDGTDIATTSSATPAKPTSSTTKPSTDKQTTPPKSEPVFCTMEAKQCPDGSYVGRDANNNCEFKACPQ